MRRATFAFYNLAPAGDPHRGPDQVRRELNAIANNHPHDPDRKRPKVIGLAEAIGRDLPVLDHYRLIRSTRSKSRANVALYVRDDLGSGAVEWLDLTKTWPRPLHAGEHEPRSILVADVEDWRIIVDHGPQEPRAVFGRRINDALDVAREEWLDAMVTLMRGPTPVLSLGDPNGLGDELVRRLGGSVVTGGTPTDAVHGRGVTITEAHTPAVVNGVTLMSDHRKVLLGRAVRR